MNAIALATHKRADILTIHLEQLLKNKNISNYILHLFIDSGAHPEIFQVVKQFRKLFNMKVTLRTQRDKEMCRIGGFYNIMESYREISTEIDDFAIIGEEDIIPTDNYLEYCEDVYNSFLSKYPRILCLAHKKRWETEIPGDPNILVGDIHCTLPSCISKQAILNHIIPAIDNTGIYTDPIRAYQNHYNATRLKPQEHVHVDGFIERIIYKNSLFSIMPDQARTMHIGVTGNNIKGTAITGNLAERILKYKTLMNDGEELRKYTELPRDICVIPKEGYPWTQLQLDTDRKLAKASTILFDPNNEFGKYIRSQQ